MDKRFVSWAAALRERDFASIADWFILYFFTVGALLLIFSGIAVGVDQGPAAGLRVFLLSSLFAAASTVSGWLFGLLFGVPRSLARGQIGTAAPPNDTQADQSQARPSATSRVNTNLEDISDWLTKTIVGVGLTQLYALPAFFWKVAGELNAHGFGWEHHGRLLALGLFFYFAPGGFWLGYVGTRTILTKLFESIDTPTIEVVTLVKDESSDRLKAFIWPDGLDKSENKENLDKLRKWMATNISADIPVATFLNAPAFAEQRKKAVADLNVQ
jgi:hypothetical protein